MILLIHINEPCHVNGLGITIQYSRRWTPLGPEAPLVAICAALGGYVSRKVFKRKNRNLIRKHPLMGMVGALAAFFGSPLGGSLFALEVNSRFGVKYFEHM